MTMTTDILPQSNLAPRILVGTDDFYDLVINSNVFVDKSLMIKELLEDTGKVILITRPRRWGKSLNMDMLRKFFEIEVDENGNPLPPEARVNYKLFAGGEIDLGLASGRKKSLKNLKISEYSDIMLDYQGKFPVILINFKEVKGSSYQEIEDKIKKQIIELFITHRYLKQYIAENNNLLEDAQKESLSKYLTGKFDKTDLEYSLKFLSELLFQHFNQKVYILIDEYDTPINTAYLKFADKRLEEFEQVLELFRGMFGSALKGNTCLEKGVVTGILRIAKANLFSDLNNLREYSLLDQHFAKFYGFTQNEVDELLTKVPVNTDPEQIKNWYNGYSFGGQTIYNPWSIMQSLADQGKLGPYWIDSGRTSIIDKAFVSDEIQEELQKLLEGEGIIKKLDTKISMLEINSNPQVFYSLLVFTGYLNQVAANDDPEALRYCLTIPNKELKEIYVTRVMAWVTSKLNINSNEYDNFIELLIAQQIEKFGKRLEKCLTNSTSCHDLTEEKDYHNLVGGLLSPLSNRYIIESNREVGHGRCDHILIPRVNYGSVAMIIEYKKAKSYEDLVATAKAGLTQINNKQYDSKIKEYPNIQKISKISISFYGKHVAIEYIIGQIV